MESSDLETSALFPDGGGRVVVREGPIDPAALLHEDEALLVERAVPKRRAEFATGRALARSALAALGVRDFVLVNDQKGAPIWPPGITGSISHSRTRCIVVAGHEANLGTLGIDVEDERELEQRLWELLFTAEEIAFLERAPELGLVFFSAKESLYKAQYPLTRRFVAHREAQLSFVRPGVLSCKLGELVVPARFIRTDHAVVTGVQIPPASRSSLASLITEP